MNSYEQDILQHIQNNGNHSEMNWSVKEKPSIIIQDDTRSLNSTSCDSLNSSCDSDIHNRQYSSEKHRRRRSSYGFSTLRRKSINLTEQIANSFKLHIKKKQRKPNNFLSLPSSPHQSYGQRRKSEDKNLTLPMEVS